MQYINIEKFQQHVYMLIQRAPIPTPFVTEEIVPIRRDVISPCTTTLEIEGVNFISTFLPSDCDICAGNEVVGTSNYSIEPVAKYRSYRFATRKDFDVWQAEYAANGQFDKLNKITLSQVEAWDKMLEQFIIWGSVTDGIPGFLSGSGIPQTIDLNTFYLSGSMTGVQMVTVLVNYAMQLAQTNNYAYKAGKMIIPSSLAEILHQTTFNNNLEVTVLQVLKERLATLPSGPVTLIGATSLNAARAIIILPDDPEAIQIHATRIQTRVGAEYITSAAATTGVIALMPTAALVVRLS